MKIKVKENVIVFDERNKKHVELKAGTYDYSNSLIGGVCLTKEFIKNSSLFEIIEDWKPWAVGTRWEEEYNAPRVEDLWSVKSIRTFDGYMLTKKEKALRKLQQIANHLNGDWKPDFTNTSQKKVYLYFDYISRKWESGNVCVTNQPGQILFRAINNDTLNQIISWMNNGDGVCMDDLITDEN